MEAEGLWEEAAGRGRESGPRTWLRMPRDYGFGMTEWETSRRE